MDHEQKVKNPALDSHTFRNRQYNTCVITIPNNIQKKILPYGRPITDSVYKQTFLAKND